MNYEESMFSEDEFIDMYMSFVDTALNLAEINRFNMNQETYLNEIYYARQFYMSHYEDNKNIGMNEVMILFEEFDAKRLENFIKNIPIPRELFVERHKENILKKINILNFKHEDYLFIIESEKHYARKMFDTLSEEFTLYGYTNVVNTKLDKLMLSFDDIRYLNLYCHYELTENERR